MFSLKKVRLLNLYSTMTLPAIFLPRTASCRQLLTLA